MCQPGFRGWYRDIGLSAVVVLIGCSSQKSPLPPDWEARRKAFPVQEAHAYTLNWAGADGARGFIKADTLRQSIRQDTLWWILKGHVEAEWAAPEQRGANRLRCEEAHLLPQTGFLKMYRAIRVTTAAGETLETDELWWDRSTGRLWAPGWVRLQTPKEEVRGWGLESTNNLRSYKLRRIQGRIQNPAL